MELPERDPTHSQSCPIIGNKRRFSPSDGNGFIPRQQYILYRVGCAITVDVKALVSYSSLFKNQAALHDSFLPEQLPERDEQLTALVKHLAPLTRNGIPQSLFLYGLPGTGKTSALRFTFRSFRELGSKAFMHIVNCRINDTFSLVMSDIKNALLAALNLPPKTIRIGLARGWHVREIADLVTRLGGGPVCIGLDEADCLSDSSIYYDLVRLPLDNAWVTLVGISNDLEYFETLPASVRSSFGSAKVMFPPYDRQQLITIATRRADVAFRQGVLKPGIIPLSAAVAGGDGDARGVLKMLEAAGLCAEARRNQTVEEFDVYEARTKLELDAVLESVRTLPIQLRLTLIAIVACEVQNKPKYYTGDVYEAYKKVCAVTGDRTYTQRSITTFLREFDKMHLCDCNLEYRGRHGRSHEVRLRCSLAELLKILEVSTAPGLEAEKELIHKMRTGGMLE